MYKLTFEYEYKIGDEVYHKVSGDKGIVLDIIYNAHTCLVEYNVCFGRFDSDSSMCIGLELSKDKVIL